ncbi:ribonuclease H-like domain-containing protein [Tanacetum coccineum]
MDELYKMEYGKMEQPTLSKARRGFKYINRQENDRYKTSEGYHAVPPPYTGNFMPPKYDLVLADEEEYVFSESVTSIPDVTTSEAKTSVSKPKSVGEPLIEDWISDSEDENETEFKSKQRKPSFAKIEFVKSNEHVKTPRESVKKVENKKQAKYPRKNSQSPRGNQRNWNNLMTQKLGSNFEFKNKACYECGSFNHLIKDCDFYEKKMVEKTVWNNARRVNHQNSQRMTHPHPKGNFVPKAVLMKSGIKTLNTAGQNFSKAAVSVNTARPINTAYPRPTVNSARTTSNVFNRAHTHVRRPFNKSTTNKNSNLKEKVNTVKGNVTTAGPKAVVSDNKGNEANAVKASACWVWRPKQKVLDHVSRHNGASMNFKRFDYGNPQLELQEKGVIDSGCSRHMTGNKSYLSDYEEIDGGFVAFGGDPKGGRITSKRKISTSKLDFEDVYFVKELKFNLLSVSQMCDKKNSVLFTDTKCVVLSSDFKLLDENHVLLRVPRKDNMYSVDLKNIVPSGGLTCLFAKATLDEPNLWHKRLRHINFKTMNKLVRGNLVRGLPSKIFENNHACVACQKGKQHKATCIENLIDLKVKVIRCDNGTEFKNRVMNQFCEMKGQADKKIVSSQEYRLLPLLTSDQSLSKGSKDSPDDGFKPSGEEEKKDYEDPGNEIGVPKKTKEPRINQEKDANVNSTNNINTASDGNITKKVNNVISTVNTDGLEDNAAHENIVYGCDDDPNMPNLKEIAYSDDDEDVGAEDDMNNLNTFIPVSPFPTIRLHKDHPLEQIIGDVHSAPQTRRMTKSVTKHDDDRGMWLETRKAGSTSYTSRREFLYGTIRKEVMCSKCQPLGFEDPEFPNKFYKVENALYGLHQAPRAWFQVTPKTSHLHVVKRIFRYLKGHLKLGLWYPRDLPFNLEAFSDSDYAGASLDRKSTTGGCQFLGRMLISWQCKKQTIVANSTTEAVYFDALIAMDTMCLWIQNQLIDYGYNFMNTKIFIDNESTIRIVKNPVFHSKTKHIEIRHHFIRDSYKKRLIQVIKIHTDYNVFGFSHKGI